MTCEKCKTEYEATNQHSECPSCGEKVGTKSEAENSEKLVEVKQWFEKWETDTENARRSSERDVDYYHGKQWTADEAAALEARGQAAIVINRIFKKINYLIGSEIRNRTDPKALPRTQQHDDDAIAATDMLRYVSDEEDLNSKFSGRWADEILPGWTGMVTETRIDGEGADKHVEVSVRDIPWDRLWWDTHSRKADFSDALYKGLCAWYDLNDLKATYGARRDAVKNIDEMVEASFQSAGGGEGDGAMKDEPSGWYDGARKRVRVCECYYREFEDGRWVWYVCHFTRAGFLIAPKPTGFEDEDGTDVCPLDMMSGFVDRHGNRYGLVRHMIGPQDEVNKRRSKALHLMSVRQIAIEETAVRNIDEARTQLAKPDGVVVLQPGAIQNERFQQLQTGDMAQGHIAMLAEAKAEIDQTGPDTPMIGSTSASSSGRQLQIRQSIGSTELEGLFDNHRKLKRAVFKQIWWRLRQFVPEERWFRVRDDAEHSGFRFVAINRNTPRAKLVMEQLQKGVAVPTALLNAHVPAEVIQQIAQQAQAMAQQGAQPGQPPPDPSQAMLAIAMKLPIMGEPVRSNEIAKLTVDILIDESPDTSIVQQEETAELRELVQTMIASGTLDPETAKFMLGLYVEASQLRSKKKILEMLRKPPNPQAVQMQQAAQQLGMAKQKAEVDVAQSQAMLNQARAQHEGAQAVAVPASVHSSALAAHASAEKDQADADAKKREGTIALLLPRAAG